VQDLTPSRSRVHLWAERDLAGWWRIAALYLEQTGIGLTFYLLSFWTYAGVDRLRRLVFDHPCGD